MGDEAPGGADFMGASKVTHPMITTCTIDFAARAITELYPASGPVKSAIIGEATKERLDRAMRKTRHMNAQLTRDIKEYRAELEQMLTQLPLGGSQYLKWYWDKRLKRPRVAFIPIDDVFLPFSASGAHSTSRLTHRQKLTPLEMETRIKTGMYRDVGLSGGSMEERSASARANDKIEGKEDIDHEVDDLPEVYEVYTWLDAQSQDKVGDFEFGPCPYIVSVDKESSEVLAVYRNWERDDKTQAALEWMVEFVFIPWRGAYGIGLPNIIGGLAAAATGAIRALLDSALINNAPSMLKLKGGRIGGQSEQVEITQITEITGAPGVDDIRKIAMPIPFNPPSPVLMQLLGILNELGSGAVQTVLKDMAQSSSETPVGTQLSRVEEGMKVFSAIHSRLHASQAKCLEVLHRLNRQYLDDEEVLDEYGELLARHDDYEGPMDVMPVSDPHIFSEAQRVAQNQGVLQLEAMAPELYNKLAVHRRVLEGMRVPAIDEILISPPVPQPQNAVAENMQMSLGQPAVAFPEQDHLAHLQVHLKFLEDPNYGASPLIAPVFTPAFLEHAKQHLTMWYANEMLQMVNTAAGEDISQVHYAADEVGRALDDTLANASNAFAVIGTKTLEGITPVIQKAIEMMQKMSPSVQDPLMLSAQAAMKDAQAKEQKVKVEAEKSTSEAKNKAAEIEMNAREAAQSDAEKAAVKLREIESRERIAREDNLVKIQVEDMADEMESVNLLSNILKPEAPKGEPDAAS